MDGIINLFLRGVCCCHGSRAISVTIKTCINWYLLQKIVCIFAATSSAILRSDCASSCCLDQLSTYRGYCVVTSNYDWLCNRMSGLCNVKIVLLLLLVYVFKSIWTWSTDTPVLLHSERYPSSSTFSTFSWVWTNNVYACLFFGHP